MELETKNIEACIADADQFGTAIYCAAARAELAALVKAQCPCESETQDDCAMIASLREQVATERKNNGDYLTAPGERRKDDAVQDLNKAIWYLQREVRRIKEGTTQHA